PNTNICPVPLEVPSAPNVVTYTLPCSSTVMPSGCFAPGGKVANRVAGVRDHACAAGARNATTSTAMRRRLRSFMGILLERRGERPSRDSITTPPPQDRCRRGLRPAVESSRGRAVDVCVAAPAQAAGQLDAIGGVGARTRRQVRGVAVVALDG